MSGEQVHYGGITLVLGSYISLTEQAADGEVLGWLLVEAGRFLTSLQSSEGTFVVECEGPTE